MNRILLRTLSRNEPTIYKARSLESGAVRTSLPPAPPLWLLFIFRSSKNPFGGGKHPPLCAGSPPGAFKEGNAALANGVLELRTIHEPGFLPAPPDPDCDCIHGEISTPLLVSTTQMQHGFYEIRAKMASAALLSSFFLQGDGGEINIFDVSPSGGAGSTFTNGYHCFNSAGTGDDTEHTSMSITGFDPQDGFHTYGIERSASGVTFYNLEAMC